MTTIIELDNLIFPEKPVDNHGWFFNNLIDWYSLSSDKNDLVERKRRHGAFRTSKSFRASAAPSFQAGYRGKNEAELLAATEKITGIGAEGPVVMRVTNALGTTERIVSVRVVDVQDHHGKTWNYFSVDCLARDPRRYSVGDDWVATRPARDGTGLVWPAVWPAQWPGDGGSDGRIVLTNRGTKPSSPVFRVYGAVTAATLVHVESQSRVGLEFPIDAGRYVEFDFARRTAHLDGEADISRYLTDREWWEIGGGETVSIQFEVEGGAGDPWAAGLVRSAW
ncbi:hypothetical protein [Lysinibacter sp. HNR]|uniref:hypothetical protein n=1 Tax=Lysinibacter sp. HNR TaxID=3031408 RepID=UPI002435F116|nr:hypothetical protein [Lysinibacter sp. HNR]WGD36829.1 hypothetical protein FrondiHNR_10260 [Lysinibacter sp. HNR]